MPAPNPIFIELIYPDGERRPIKSTLTTFSVGSGDESDLVIPDSDIANPQFRVRLGPQSVFIRPESFALEPVDTTDGSITTGDINSVDELVESESEPSVQIGQETAWPFGKPYRFGEYTLIFTQTEIEKSPKRRFSLENFFQGLVGPSFSFRLIRFVGVPMSSLKVARWPILILFASGLTIGSLYTLYRPLSRMSNITPRAKPTAIAETQLENGMAQLPTLTPTPTETPTPTFVVPSPTPTAPSLVGTRTGTLQFGPDIAKPTSTPTLNAAETAQGESNAPPTATVGPTPTTELRKLSATLEALGIWVEAAQVEPGDVYWHLINVEWWDVERSGGRHHIFIEVIDENGQRILNQPVTVSWPDGQLTRPTHKTAPDPYAYEFPMGAAGHSYNVKIQGLPSDVLHGAGLGTIEQREHNLLTSYVLIYQRRQKS